LLYRREEVFLIEGCTVVFRQGELVARLQAHP